jgi:U3 small nucleolar RNA-associated protein 23
MEPISTATLQVRRADELNKFREGIRKVGAGQKRKRDDEASRDEGENDAVNRENGGRDEVVARTGPTGVATAIEKQEARKKKKRKYGLKGPNPLSVKKARKPAKAKA